METQGRVLRVVGVEAGEVGGESGDAAGGGLDAAEAVLTLRAILTNGDFTDYWHHHQQQEHHRYQSGDDKQELIIHWTQSP